MAGHTTPTSSPVSHPNTAPDTSRLSSQQGLAIWCELVDMGEWFMRCDLKKEVGPGGDIDAAFRHWYKRAMNDRDREIYGVEC